MLMMGADGGDGAGGGIVCEKEGCVVVVGVPGSRGGVTCWERGGNATRRGGGSCRLCALFPFFLVYAAPDILISTLSYAIDVLKLVEKGWSQEVTCFG